MTHQAWLVLLPDNQFVTLQTGKEKTAWQKTTFLDFLDAGQKTTFLDGK